MSIVDFGSAGDGSLPGRGSPHAGSPRALTWSKGNLPFYVPDYSPGGTPLSLVGDRIGGTSPEDDKSAKARIVGASLLRDPSPGDLSPSSRPSANFARAVPSAQPRRRSHGPDVDFTETEVNFFRPAPAAAHTPDADSEDDSDDGLFAVPIASRTSGKALVMKAVAQQAAKLAEESSGEDGSRQPSLAADRADGKRARKKSVQFTPSPESTVGGGLPTPDGEEEDPTRSAKSTRRTPATPVSEGWESAEESKLSRRKSFIERDVWANRPPPTRSSRALRTSSPT